MHVDTTWKFPAIITFRDEFCRKNNLDLIVWWSSSEYRCHFHCCRRQADAVRRVRSDGGMRALGAARERAAECHTRGSAPRV